MSDHSCTQRICIEHLFCARPGDSDTVSACRDLNAVVALTSPTGIFFPECVLRDTRDSNKPTRLLKEDCTFPLTVLVLGVCYGDCPHHHLVPHLKRGCKEQTFSYQCLYSLKKKA